METPADIDKIWAINAAAFGAESEANLVNVLRGSGVWFLSLVYERDGELLGHILFTAVELLGKGSGLRIAALGPMAVLPQRQRSGIGNAMVEEGINRCREAGFDAMVVVGYPEYYGRFGFSPASGYHLECEYEVPDDVFMALELRTSALAEAEGMILYHDAFNRF